VIYTENMQQCHHQFAPHYNKSPITSHEDKNYYSVYTHTSHHSAHPAWCYTYTLSATPYLAGPMLSCCPVKEFMLPACWHCSVPCLQWQGQPVANVTQGYRLRLPSATHASPAVPQYIKNANFLAPYPWTSSQLFCTSNHLLEALELPWNFGGNHPSRSRVFRKQTYIHTELQTYTRTALYTYIYTHIYRVAHNKIPHQTICNISATSGLIIKILEAA